MSIIPAINDTALADDDIIQRKSGAWVNRTVAQYKTDLTLVKADVGLGSVENTALSTWPGSTNLTTLGTISSGIWNGTAIPVANGGTGSTTAPNARTALGLGNVENTALSTWAGSANITTLGTISSGSIPAANVTGLSAGANPTGTVGLAAVNGSATSFMRSDGAPSLSQSIAPTWTGAHTFTNALPITISSAEPRWAAKETDAGADGGLWDFDVNAGVLTGRTRTDADGAGVSWLTVTRTAASTAISDIGLGNTTNNPTGHWLGTGAFTFGGSIVTGSIITVGRVAVTSSSIPANGIYLPGTNRLAFSSNTLNRGEFDANGNFITKKAVSDQSYSLQVPTTGFSITIADNTSALILNPAGTLATGTVTMPATPIDGQIVRVSSSQIVTGLTVSANSGQTISNAPTTLAAGAGFGYIYNVSGTNWFRLY